MTTSTITAEERRYPSADSVKGRTLGMLLRGERITHKDVWMRLGSARASHHVMVLRDAGWPIETEDLDVRTSDAGRVATIARYSLSRAVIDEAGERGQQYAQICERIERERRAA